MNKILALILVSLLISQSLALQLSKSAPISTVFAQVSEESEFGKTMTSLIQMQMADPESRLKEINDVLQSIYAEYTTYNEREAERFNKADQQCKSEIRTLQEQLETAQSQLDDNSAERTALIEEQGKLQVLLRDEENNLQQMREDLAQAEQDLEDENESFERKQRDYNALIVACEAGIDLLLNMIHGTDQMKYGQRQGAAFVQLTQVKDQFSTVLKDFKQHSSLALLEPVLNSLVALSSSTSINYEQFIQCIELLQDILARLRQDLTLLTNRHNQIVEDLTELIGNLNKWIQTSLNIIDIYTQRLAEIKARLAELVGLIDQVSAFIAVLTKDLAAAQTQCDAQEAAYREAQAVRDSEIAVMSELIQYFESQVVLHVGNVRDEAIV